MSNSHVPFAAGLVRGGGVALSARGGSLIDLGVYNVWSLMGSSGVLGSSSPTSDLSSDTAMFAAKAFSSNESLRPWSLGAPLRPGGSRQLHLR